MAAKVWCTKTYVSVSGTKLGVARRCPTPRPRPFDRQVLFLACTTAPLDHTRYTRLQPETAPKKLNRPIPKYLRCGVSPRNIVTYRTIVTYHVTSSNFVCQDTSGFLHIFVCLLPPCLRLARLLPGAPARRARRTRAGRWRCRRRRLRGQALVVGVAKGGIGQLLEGCNPWAMPQL